MSTYLCGGTLQDQTDTGDQRVSRKIMYQEEFDRPRWAVGGWLGED